MATDMDVDEPATPWLDTVEGEIAFFRSLMRARPVGIHRHFHVLTMRNAILRDTGQLVEVEDLWRKLRACYDLDILENIVSEPPVCPLSRCAHRSLTIHVFSYLFHLPCTPSMYPMMQKYRKPTGMMYQVQVPGRPHYLSVRPLPPRTSPSTPSSAANSTSR